MPRRTTICCKLLSFNQPRLRIVGIKYSSTADFMTYSRYDTSLICVSGDECEGKSPSIKLKKTLLCGYDRTVRPTKVHTTSVRVKVLLGIRHFSFEEAKNIVILYTWTLWSWEDEHLTWDPNSNNGVSDLRVDSEEIWVPDVAIYTMGDMGGHHHRIPSTSCILKNNGNLRCVPPTAYVAQCSPDLTRWPFDSQECNVEMGSWTHNANELNITLRGQGVVPFGLDNNREWRLLNSTAVRDETKYGNESFPYLVFQFKLQRHSAGHAATVAIPALVLAVLTLLMFCLEPTCPERLNLGCMNVLVHCLYLQFLGVKLPSNGDSTPLIVVFFRDSLLLVGMALVTAVTLRGMMAAERPPPGWLTTVISGVLGTRPGQLLILSELDPQDAAATSAEDGAGLVDAAPDAPKIKVWRFAAILLDRVCFLVFALTLLILLMAFVP